tara:strand:+ start:170 stop:640 length:471 start_codon:yes stop_codon:yes gene_type:complete
MKLKVIRYSTQEDSTNGALFVENDGLPLTFLCYTLEDEYRKKKVMSETRIPKGEYQIKLRKEGGFHARYSEKFPNMHIGMLHIIDVPNFEYILIHIGNTAEDTGGCLLVGDSQENNILRKNGFIGSSTQAYKRIYPEISSKIESGEEVTIEYIDLA